VDDIVDGIIRSIENVKGFEIFNLGESKTISVNDLISVFEDVTGKKAITKNMPMQPGDVMQTYANISKAKNMLGYNPQTDIPSGVKKLYEWYQKIK